MTEQTKENSESISDALLLEYATDNFVETGSYLGGGIATALRCGFRKVYSIENNKEFFDSCYNKYRENTKVNLYYGRSESWLKIILSDIKVKSTFWLDAHWINGEAPLLDELEIIKTHPVKNHFILIDDIHWGKNEAEVARLGGSELEVKTKLLEINPGYSFVYRPQQFGLRNPKGILIAYDH